MLGQGRRLRRPLPQLSLLPPSSAEGGIVPASSTPPPPFVLKAELHRRRPLPQLSLLPPSGAEGGIVPAPAPLLRRSSPKQSVIVADPFRSCGCSLSLVPRVALSLPQHPSSAVRARIFPRDIH